MEALYTLNSPPVVSFNEILNPQSPKTSKNPCRSLWKPEKFPIDS